MMTRFFILFLISAGRICVASPIDDFNQYFRVTPTPQKIDILNGKRTFIRRCQRIYLSGLDKLPPIAGLLQSLIISEKPGTGTVTLHLTDAANLPAHRKVINWRLRTGKSLFLPGQPPDFFMDARHFHNCWKIAETNKF